KNISGQPQTIDGSPLTILSYQDDGQDRDSINTFLNTAIDFNPTTPTNSDSSTPTLDSPNTNGSTGPQPYEPLEQAMIKQFYSHQVMDLLNNKQGLSQDDINTIYQDLMNGTMPTDPNLLAIATEVNSEATATPIQQGNLPSS